MNTLNFIKSLKDTSFTNIRSSLFKQRILCNYSNDKRLILLYTSKNNRFNVNQYNKLHDECNGLIIDIIDMKIISTPINSAKSNINVDRLNDDLKLDLYDIFLIKDGTLVNLYFYNNKWSISTYRSIDATNATWGNSTYGSLFHEVLAELNINKDNFYDSLDIKSSYTFGFKHHNIHPFKDSDVGYDLWFIQSVMDNNVSKTFENTLGIVSQPIFNFPDGERKHTSFLFKLLSNSFQSYILNRSILYGYILKLKNAPNDTTNDATNGNVNSPPLILLESSLLQKIRLTFYHSKFDSLSKQIPCDRDLFTVAYNYFDKYWHRQFIALFPKFQPYYTEFNNTITKISKKIQLYHTKPDIYDTSDIYNTIVHLIYGDIIKSNNANQNNFKYIRTIKKFIMSMDYLYIFIDILNRQSLEIPVLTRSDY